MYTDAGLAGHKDIKTTQRYAHLSLEKLRPVIQILNFGDSGWKWESAGSCKSLVWMVGATGFELSASWTPCAKTGVSAIEFKLTVHKVVGEKGEDRMVVTMNGKFLPHIEQTK